MKHNQTIQIFSADHHETAIYKLPFIRVSDKKECPINICNDDFLYANRDILSEVSRILYINKHLDDFGNPDYVGFCHYRRFFANLSIKSPQLETSDLNLLNSVFNPIDQMAILQQNNADGIIEEEFLEVRTGATNMLDWFKDINKMLNYLQIPTELIDYSYQTFLNEIPNWIKQDFIESLNIMPIYHSNMFTFKSQLSKEMLDALQKSVEKIIQYESNNLFDRRRYSSRWLGYVIEYLYTNVYFHALEKSKKVKIIKCKFLTFNK